VLDQTGGFHGPLDVTVVNGVITGVGSRVDAPDAIPIDCDGLFLMPGIFDCHDHVALSSLDSARLLQTPITEWALRAAANMQRTLAAGVTFVRDAGGADAGMRNAVSNGYVAGPRIQVAVVPLCQTGGHFDGFLPGAGIEMADGYLIPDYPGRPPYLVDGVDAMRRTVRTVLRAGADWIKLCATGGITSTHTEDSEWELAPDEIRTAVVEAARKGKGVMAHAFGGAGLDNAINAGVRSIEHGLFLTEAQAERMAAADVWLVPTLIIVRDLIRWAKAGSLSTATTRKALAIEPKLADAVQIARAAGVRIALGTDFVSSEQHGLNLGELVLMHEAGLSAEETLLAATIRGAELCGVADRYGRTAPGYFFDAILLDEDPSDISIFARPDAVTGVFKGGAPVLRHQRFER
jgi:imidazolonepropionase-like amidohydrolase